MTRKPFLRNDHLYLLPYTPQPLMKPSKVRQKEDAALVSLAIQKSKATDYLPAMNPHPERTLRHDRFRRRYERGVVSFRRMDACLNDLFEVYGYPSRQ